MGNEILKTIKINVNSSEYKALQKSLNEIAKVEKEINTLKAKNAKSVDEMIRLKKEELAVAKKEEKISEETYNKKLKDLEVEKKVFQLEQKKAKLLESYSKKAEEARKKEREDRLKEAKESFTNAPVQRAREALRAKTEEGKQSGWYFGQRYKGIGGAFTYLSDKAQKAGEEKVAAFDEQIARQEDIKKLNKEKIAKYQDELQSGNLTPKQIEYRKEKIAALQEESKIAGSKIEDIKDKRSQAIGDTKTQMNKYAALAQAAQKAGETLKKIGNVLLAPFKKLANATMDAVKQMLDFKTGVATFSTSTSLITNSAAREQQMKYGLTSSQNYAFSQAKSMLNIQSDEDLMYMNKDQRDKFLSYMQRYSAWYDEMESSGVLANIQEMQLEFQELKQEIAMEFLQWVAENKETIMTCIKGIFEFIKKVANVVIKIMEILSLGKNSGETIADTSDTNNYNTNNNNSRSTVINVNANTTNNATGVLGSQEAMNQFSQENFNRLAKQIAGALGV